jgi:hypothetical protein
MNNTHLDWWANLRHGGLLLDPGQLHSLVPQLPPQLSSFQQSSFRSEWERFKSSGDPDYTRFISFIYQYMLGYQKANLGHWQRGNQVESCYSHTALTGEAIRPNHLWIAKNHSLLPLFIDKNKRLGLGRGRRIYSNILRWLRQSGNAMAVLTNGYQWRIIFAGMDYDAFTEWETEQWFAAGEMSPEFRGFQALMQGSLWIKPDEQSPTPFVQAVNDSRKGQADLSGILGERVREAVETLILAHTEALNKLDGTIKSEDIYLAAVRIVMRLVVILFAESREGLLPKDQPIYYNHYSLDGLRSQLEQRSQHQRKSSFSAWPRLIALFYLISHGGKHSDLNVNAYGGEIFAPGQADSPDAISRAIALFEGAAFDSYLINDQQVFDLLSKLSKTEILIQQGRSRLRTTVPVDFSSLGNEYIGILYEGLLDFELRQAVPGEPVIFLNVGNQPALPLSMLQAMDNKSLKSLLEKLKDEAKKNKTNDDSTGEEEDGASNGDELGEDEPDEDNDSDEELDETDEGRGEPASEIEIIQDERYTLQQEVYQWAVKACEIGGLIHKPKKPGPEAQLKYKEDLNRRARKLIGRLILPGEWYLVRWGGTRKGSGTFYTRPQLAIPTVNRTLLPLAYIPPKDEQGKAKTLAPIEAWTPKRPEDILRLKVVDPACGSGSFLLAALRFLTEALYQSLHVHNRIRHHHGRAVLDLIFDENQQPKLSDESLPMRPDDDQFDFAVKAKLRRYVVERCIYGVDYNPLAVELARLSLWIETMNPEMPLTFLNHKIKVGNSLVGTWFDRFLHYPAMAWFREGGDTNHTNGVHFQKGDWTNAIKDAKKQVISELIDLIDGASLFYPMDITNVSRGHDAAEAALEEIHFLGITEIPERMKKYEELQQNEDYQQLRFAFDTWCAIWFWPGDELEHAPMPLNFARAQISPEATRIINQLTQQHRFFHWELEFPDVFNARSKGFDAVVGNPPWETLQPVSKEYFSAIDPMYRSYGKQEALKRQSDYYLSNIETESAYSDLSGH